MRYLEATPKKLSFVASIGILLVLLIFGIFLFKDVHFGSERLPNAIERVVTQAFNEIWYRIRFESSMFASVSLSFFSDEKAWNEYTNRAAQALPVLLYHGMKKNEDDYAVSQEQFASHMKTLHDAGWRTVTLEEFEKFLRGKQTLPERSFLLTFDDGAKESYYPTDPILATLSMNAASFILPKYSNEQGTSYYLSSGEVETMLKSGRWEIGSHGQNSHDIVYIDADGEEGPYLANRIWLAKEERIETEDEYEERVTRDLASSKALLEQRFKVPITTFAFPFGEFGHLSTNHPEADVVVHQSAQNIYDMSFYQTWEGEGYSFNYPTVPEGEMVFAKRIEPTPNTTAKELLKSLEYGLPKNLPFEDTFKEERGWFSVWGVYEHRDGILSLESAPEESGNAVVLNGTGHWENYRVRATINSPLGTGIFMWVRFADRENNAGCNFGNGFVHAEEMVENVRNVNAGNRGDMTIPDGNFTVEARVEDRTLTCVLNDTYEVSTQFLDPSLSRGGIGFKAWQPKLGEAQFIVKSLTVETW